MKIEKPYNHSEISKNKVSNFIMKILKILKILKFWSLGLEKGTQQNFS